MTGLITDLTAVSALAATHTFEVTEDPSGTPISKKATADQIKTFVAGPLGATQIFGGRLLNANMDSTADQQIPIVLPPGFTRWRLNNIFAIAASVSLTTAAGGVYPTTGKGGTAIVANTQVYTGLTAAANNTAGGFLALSAAAGQTNVLFDIAAIYLSLTTPQGAAAVCDIYVNVSPFP